MGEVQSVASPAGQDVSVGRSAPVASLRRALSTAPPSFLEGALDNPLLGIPELLLLLRNRRAPAAVLCRVGADPRWVRNGDVRRRLVAHPETPLAVARRLLPLLGWSELAETALSARARAAVRRDAERLLVARIPELARGERIGLARRATAQVLAALVPCRDARVLEGVLDNPRLTDCGAARIAGDPCAPVATLALLADHARWAESRPIRLALVRNPRTPAAAALRVVGRLEPADLRLLVDDGCVPVLVRVAAARRATVAAR